MRGATVATPRPLNPTYRVNPGSVFPFKAQVKNHNADAITQASLTSIAYAVVDTSDGSSVGTGTLAISTAVFDTLQTGEGWPHSTGYNFEWDVAPTLTPAAAGDEYQVTITFTPTDATKAFTDRFKLRCE